MTFASFSLYVDPALEDRLCGWQRSLMQFAIAFLLCLFLVTLNASGGSFDAAMSAQSYYALVIFAVTIVAIRRLTNRLPEFLR